MPRIRVIRRERSAPKKVMRTRNGPIRRIDALEDAEKLSQCCSEVRQVSNGFAGRRLAVDPAVDGPLPGIAFSRNSHCQRERDRERQERRKGWQPALLLFDLRRIPRGTR